MSCTSCKKRSLCAYVDAVWYPPKAIVYCRPQVLWYLEHADIFRDGKWVPESRVSSYTDLGIRSRMVKIPKQLAEQFAAEIDSRLKKCGIEGKLLEMEVQLQREFSPSSWKVLNYISGWRRKKMSFQKWKSKSRPQNVSKR